jgi:asparagine synthase (glutamine-hydrolysing)
MCGIAGFVDRNARLDAPAAALRAMADAVAHRGPDGHGTFEDPARRIGIAHRRLAAQDDGAGGTRPVRSASGRWVVAMDGVLWSGEGARADSAHEVAARLDARGLPEALPDLDGVFALAALDLRERVLWLARDPEGVKPLLAGYAEPGAGPGVFVFGSETRALEACPCFANRISPLALGHVLQGGWVTADEPLHRGIHPLRPGEAVRLELGTGRLQRVPWRRAREAAAQARAAPFEGTRDEAARALSALLDAAVRRRLPGDGPVAVPLSGGVGSSLVLSALHRAGARGARLVALGVEDAEFDERPHARAVARWFGVECVEHELDERELPVLAEDAIACMDAPHADPAVLRSLAVARVARGAASVALLGEGGCEVLGGRPAHLHGAAAAWALARVPRPLRAALARAIAALPAERFDAVQAPFEHLLPAELRRGRRAALARAAERALGAADLDEAWRFFEAVWEDPSRVVIALPGDAWRAALRRMARTEWRPLPAEENAFLDEILLRDQTRRLPDGVLARVDRTAGECGLDARLPLLDRRVIEFSWRVPPAWRTEGGVGTRLMREALALHAPIEIAWRPRARVALPLGRWLAGPLREWAEAVLAPARMDAHGVLDPGPVRAAWARCLAGDEAAAREAWAACCLARWCERRKVDARRLARL